MTCWIDQVEPSQTSTNGSVRPVSVSMYEPTAAQLLEDVQDTPTRTLSDAKPLGVEALELGVLEIIQLVPFQASATAAGPERPTAVQALGRLQEIPFSVGPAGVFCIVQLVPFQASAPPARPPRKPTA